MGTKIAIVGSRDYQHLDRVRTFVESLPPDTVIVSGGARGVDREAEVTAKRCGLKVIVFYPNWKPNGVYDNQAGMKRNALIINEADQVVAFWDGKSTGTLNSIKRAKRANKPVQIIN